MHPIIRHRIINDFVVLLCKEVNDAAKNDEMETVPPEVMKQLAEMGAFGMQVWEREKYIHMYIV